MKKLVFANIWFCCVGFIIFECNNNNNTIATIPKYEILTISRIKVGKLLRGNNDHIA